MSGPQIRKKLVVPRRIEHRSYMEEGKEMSNVDSERERLVAAPESEGSPSTAPTSTNMTLHCMNLSGLFLAFVTVGVVAYYSFRGGATLFSFHPLAMTLGWLVLMPLAINSLRKGDPATSWMPARLASTRHWILQAAAAITIGTGSVAIFVNKIRLGKDHFTTVHAIFGAVSVTLVLLTLSGGVAALYSLKLKERISPACTKIIHGYAGTVTFTMGTITVILGIFSHVVDDVSAQWLMTATTVTVALLTVLRPVISLTARLKERFTR